MPTGRPLARISMTIPPDVLRRADRIARHEGRSRSWVLAEAVPSLAAGGPVTAAAYGDACAHLRNRIERFPLTLSAPIPGAAR